MRIVYYLILLCLIATAVFFFHPAAPPVLVYEDTVSKQTLDNGLTAIVKSSGKVPMAAVKLVIKAGSSTEGKYAGSGISHFVEHMLFKGTANLPVGEIEKRIKSYGGSINASTSHDKTAVYFTVEAKHLEKALSLLSDFVFNPSFNESEFQKEKEVILNEIRMGRDDPSRESSRLLWETAYSTHPYRYPVIGYEELFRQLKRSDLVEYHSAHYVPNNCALSIVGDVGEQEALKYCAETLGKLPRRPDPVIIKAAEPLQMSERSAQARKEGLKLSRVLIAFHTTSLADKDLYPLDLLAAVLGQGESSRLYRSIIKDKRLAFSVSAYNYTPSDPGIFIVSMVLDEANASRAVEAVLSEISAVKKRSLTSRELAKVKRAVISDYIYGKESIETQADDLVSGYVFTGDYNYSRRYIEGLGRVRAADIRRAASHYLNIDNMTVVKLMPALKGTQEAAPSADPAKQIDIISKKLGNGAILLISRDDSLPVVSVCVAFKGGVRAEDESNNGITKLMSGMLLKGTRMRSAAAIAEETESRGIEISGFSGKNAFGISAKCLKSDFRGTLSLMRDILANPRFPEKELAIAKQLQLAAIKAQDDDIFAVASKELIRTVFLSHPYGMPDLGSAESVSRIGRKDLMDFYRYYAVPENMVIAAFGDIDAGMQRRIASAFGSFQKESFRGITVPREQEQLAPRKASKTMPKEQSVLMLGYPGIDVKDKDKYVLDVINSILSRDGGRLYRDIRGKLGLSYALGSFSVAGIDPGYNAFYVSASSKDISEAKGIILNDLKALKAEGPTQEEIEHAKSDLKGSYYMGLEVNSDVAFRACLDELYGLGSGEFLKYPEMVDAVTAKDVMTAVKRYFPDSKMNEVIVTP
ncbi:MAG TPA: pitrilysin family protein [Candidatus Omnitrophota bacterium]|nr:insulinase family protein [Candidatus Omnitrophota bacterium]HOX09410.1 pitrilysin family protein [Candidatus Omnitrophota bacterium]